MRPDDFVEQYWERRHFVLKRGSRHHYDDLLTLGGLDELVYVTAQADPRSGIRLVRTDPDGVSTSLAPPHDDNGAPDIHKIYRSFRRGYSVVVNGVHRRRSTIATLCRSLETTFRHPVGANVYLTPGGNQGFRPHVDTHDVLVLQIHGTKRWQLGSPPYALPLVDAPPADPTFDAASSSVVLEPGDLLYVPRGCLHAAIADDRSSLHITVGIHAYRWLDLVKEVVEILAEDDIELRRALPSADISDVDLRDRVLALFRSGSAHVAAGDASRRAHSRLERRLVSETRGAPEQQFASIDAVDRLTVESEVWHAPSIHTRLRTDAAGTVSIDFTGNFVSAPDSLASAMRFIAENPVFVIGDIPGDLSDESKKAIADRLISEGLLQTSHREEKDRG